MPHADVVMNVRKVSNTASIIDIKGEISAFGGTDTMGGVRGGQHSYHSYDHIEL